jgi:hypothetical protein
MEGKPSFTRPIQLDMIHLFRQNKCAFRKGKGEDEKKKRKRRGRKDEAAPPMMMFGGISESARAG